VFLKKSHFVGKTDFRISLGCDPFDAFKCSEHHASNATLWLVH